jgi:hypothetical protein
LDNILGRPGPIARLGIPGPIARVMLGIPGPIARVPGLIARVMLGHVGGTWSHCPGDAWTCGSHCPGDAWTCGSHCPGDAWTCGSHCPGDGTRYPPHVLACRWTAPGVEKARFGHTCPVLPTSVQWYSGNPMGQLECMGMSGAATKSVDTFTFITSG